MPLNPIFWWFILSVVVFSMILFIPFLWYLENQTDTSEIFECGIEPFNSHQIPVYMHFFIVGLIFLVFDMEMVVSVPLVYLSSHPSMWGWVWLAFISTLIIGLLLEVFLGSLDWKE